jgi:hypothetical protein
VGTAVGAAAHVVCEYQMSVTDFHILRYGTKEGEEEDEKRIECNFNRESEKLGCSCLFACKHRPQLNLPRVPIEILEMYVLCVCVCIAQ